MLDVRAGKIQVQRGNQSWRRRGGGSREDDGEPCWFSSFRGGVPEEKEEAEEDRGEEAGD